MSDRPTRARGSAYSDGVDPLADALALIRRGEPHAAAHDLSGPWRLVFPAVPDLGFHVLTRGRGWLDLEDECQPVPLEAGDVVLISDGGRHTLRHDPPSSSDRDPPEGPAGQTPASRPARLVCAAFPVDRERSHPLITGLPRVIHLTASDALDPAVAPAAALLDRELSREPPGHAATVPALLDLLLIGLLRSWSRGAALEARGWAAALDDPAIAAALDAIHRRPHEPWTLDALARLVGLSRSTFVARFTARVGQPPLRYLTWWRMTRAAAQLRRGDEPLRHIATANGYSTEFAFAKAFRREIGVPPGTYRSRHRTTADS